MKKSLIVVSAILLASLLAFAAGLGGTWNIQGAVSGAPQRLVFTTNGNTFTGTLDGGAISGGGIEGTMFWFTAARNGVTYHYKGTLNGNSLELHESLNQQHNMYTYTRAGS